MLRIELMFMKKWIGWIGFFLVVIVLGVGGLFLIPLFQGETFSFKKVEILEYDDYSLNDLVEQDVICNSKGCKFKDKDVVYTISEVKTLGKQDVNLKIEYEGETFEKTFYVDVVDRVAPEIGLSDTALIVDKNEKIDPSSYITSVKDNYDELNIEDIVVLNNVDLATPGDYEVIYTIKDSSDNEGRAILKVKVKGNRETITSNKNETNESTSKDEDFKIDFQYTISGLFNETGSLNQDNLTSSVEKTIEVGWDSSIKISSKTNVDASIQYIISKNKITSDPVIVYNGSPIVKSVSVKAGSSNDFEYTFIEEGTYYVLIRVKANDGKITLNKEFVLHLTSPSEVKDMKILTEDKGSYISIDCNYIGGKDNDYYFVAALTDSDDPKALEEEIIVNKDNEIRLYYTSSYYYDIAGMLFTEDGDLVKMETLKIQK